METATDSYRFDRLEMGTEEVQREIRRRFKHTEACFQHFEDRLDAAQRRLVLGIQGTVGIAVFLFVAQRLVRRSR